VAQSLCRFEGPTFVLETTVRVKFSSKNGDFDDYNIIYVTE
jgi:hypothetical protein